MSGNGNQVPLAPSQRGPGSYPRAPTPHRAECYHPPGATGGAYMSSTAGGAQSTAQASLRVQPTPQQSGQQAPQQDMSKTTMAGHSYGPPQNQAPQARQQFPSFPYRATQHASRPNPHARPQQPYMGATATATGPVMFHPALVYQPTTHMGLAQSYQQPRSQGYFPYVAPYIAGYSPPASHTQPYYYSSNGQQIPAPNLPANTPGGRSNPTTLVGPQGMPATPTAPTVTMPHPQAPAHIYPSLPGMRAAPTKQRSHRVPIIDPATQQEVIAEPGDSQHFSLDSNERHTPQLETSSAAAELMKRVHEDLHQSSSHENTLKNVDISKNVEMPIPSTSSLQPQTSTLSSVNNNVAKSDILTVNEIKNLGPDVAVEPNETPVVSAISDSPVIVPKMPTNIKQLQKNSEQNVQPLVLDTNKNLPSNKQHKQNKQSKPVVPQIDEVEKVSEASPAAATVSAPPAPAPQPQRVRERERLRSEEKDRNKDKEAMPEAAPSAVKPNGPTSPVVISSVDSLPEVINPPTSQSSQVSGLESNRKQVQKAAPPESEVVSSRDSKSEPVNKPEVVPLPTATELLSASIEKHAKESAQSATTAETSSASQAQAKLTQSLANCRIRANQPEFKMKDINLNNKTTDPDTANGNPSDVTKTETVKEDINKNEKVGKGSKNSSKKAAKMATNETNVKEVESYENGKDETDKVSAVVEDEKALPTTEEATASALATDKSDPAAATVFVPKYKYTDDQWSPLNKSGKKCYDILLLKQIKEDPLSKNKPNVPLLEACNVIRTAPMQEPMIFTLPRNGNDSFLLPNFAKGSGMGSRSNTSRDAKKDGRNMAPNVKGSGKLSTPSSGSRDHKPVNYISLREDVKLNETENAWKPSVRARKDNLSEEEVTQDLYKKFRGILNKLTPQKFDTLLEKVKTLDINNQKRLEGVIDLVFEKAIDEPNFSEAYAAMCNKLSTLKVPADNATNPEQCVNFRALIISKCQNQFVTEKVDEQVQKLEKDLAEQTDPAKKKELTLMLNEENRRVRMRSVGNVRFIGELYKLKMLTSKIMVYCMNYLIEKLEEEKLECLCKLLTTIGEQVENEVREQLDLVFKKMQEIVERKNQNKISSRVRFMIQDVIELRRKKWASKSVVDSQPKMMDQIQKEAEQQHRNIEIMNANPMGGGGGYRRDDGGRGKRDSRRQGGGGGGATSYMESNWKTRSNYPLDTSKLNKVVSTAKYVGNIKLAPQNSIWNQGSGTKNTAQTGSSNSMISLTATKNMYSVLDTTQADPTSFRGNTDLTPNYSKGASIERSTFNSRSDFSSGGGSRSGSIGVARSNSGSRSPAAPPPAVDAPAPPPAVPQEPLPDAKKKSVKSTIDLSLLNNLDDDEMVTEIKHHFPPQYHAAVISEILNIALEKSPKEIEALAKALLHLVSTNTISAENFVAGLTELCEIAPDLYIDIPMLYDNLGKFIAPQIEKKHVTFVQTLRFSETIISSNQGHLFLKAVIKQMKDSMGASFVKSKWQDSGLHLKQWMKEEQVSSWLADNKFEFLEGCVPIVSEEPQKKLTPAETQSKLLQLMNSDENCECIRGWVQDNLGKQSNEDWFMRALNQAICEHALFGPDGSKDAPHFNQDRMNKYSGLINEFGESREAREASCLFGIQQLLHNLEHPQGLTLEIFQYLHEQYIINPDGFIAWEESEKEPEGKGVMMKALTSFFTSLKEADNEDTCSED